MRTDITPWARATMTPEDWQTLHYAAGVALPDVPLAFVPEGEARAMWGNR